MKTIGLCMIVKNEAHVILRCLASARPLVDYVLVEDTGSTDGTQEIIRAYLRDTGIPGIVIEEPWRDFAYNRSFALQALRRNDAIDYALIIDADDVIAYEGGFDAAAFKAGLTADLYHVAETSARRAGRASPAVSGRTPPAGSSRRTSGRCPPTTQWKRWQRSRR